MCGKCSVFPHKSCVLKVREMLRFTIETVVGGCEDRRCERRLRVCSPMVVYMVAYGRIGPPLGSEIVGRESWQLKT